MKTSIFRLLIIVLLGDCGCWTIATQRAFWDKSYYENAVGEGSVDVPVPDVYVYGGTINMFPAIINAGAQVKSSFSFKYITFIT